MKKRSYTLIEIMLVVVIAALLFGIGIPAFSTMIQGNSMTIAIRQLSAKIQAARAYAVMNRCRVAILLPNSSTSTMTARMRGTAYRVCTLDSSNQFDGWIEDEEWKTLPSGILRIYSDCDPTNNVTVSIPGSMSSGTGTADIPCSIPALIFGQDGRLTAACTNGINLTHGRYIDTAGYVFTNRDASRNTTDPNILTTRITINRYTGRTATDQNVYYGSAMDAVPTQSSN